MDKEVTNDTSKFNETKEAYQKELVVLQQAFMKEFTEEYEALRDRLCKKHNGTIIPGITMNFKINAE